MDIRYLLLDAYVLNGSVRAMFDQASAMAAAGHEVEVVSVLRRNDVPYHSLSGEVTLSPLTDSRFARSRVGPGAETPPEETRKRLFTWEAEHAVTTYLRRLESRGYDGVLVADRPGTSLLLARYGPSQAVRIAQEHMHFYFHKPALRKEVLDGYPRLDAVAVLTEADRRAYSEAMGRRMRIERIPNAVECVDVAVSDHSRKVIVAAGRLVPQKGFDLLLNAFVRVVYLHPDWQLRIYGSGRDEPKLRDMILNLGLYNHVFLMGASRRLGEEMAKASIYALSSRYEGFGLVVAEGMSHGLPVVAFDCPEGPGEIITDGVDGLLVRPTDVERLATALCTLIEDEPRRRMMGKSAREAVARYSPEIVYGRWERLLEELVRQRRRGGDPASRSGQAIV